MLAPARVSRRDHHCTPATSETVHPIHVSRHSYGQVRISTRRLSFSGRHPGHHPFKDHRPVIDAILWVLATGAAWRDLPERLGPRQTAYGRFSRWRTDGTWDRVTSELLTRAEVDGDLWCINGTTVRATRAAAGARKKVPAG